MTNQTASSKVQHYLNSGGTIPLSVVDEKNPEIVWKEIQYIEEQKKANQEKEHERLVNANKLLTKSFDDESIKEKLKKDKEEPNQVCFIENGEHIYHQTLNGFVNEAGDFFQELTIGDKKYVPIQGEELETQGGRNPFLLLAEKPEPYGGFATLINDTDAFIKKYVDVNDDFRRITALYAALTWFQDKLRTVPYWRVKGDFGQGKTRAWEVAKSICLNPLSASGALTSAPIFRIIEKWRLLTLSIDEADLREGDATNDIIKIINTGFEAGGGVMRCDPNNASQIQFFRTYCPKLFSMRQPFADNATESRCLSSGMEATRRSDIPVELSSKFDKEALALRNRFLDFRLKKWKSFEPAENPPFPTKLEGRLKQIAIAFYPLLETDAERDWFNTWLVSYQRKLREERSNSYSGQVLQIIRDQADAFEDALPTAATRFVTNQTVGYILKEKPQTVAKETKSLGFKTEFHKWRDNEERQRSARKLVIDREQWSIITNKYAPEGVIERPLLIIPEHETLVSEVSVVSEVSAVSGGTPPQKTLD